MSERWRGIVAALLNPDLRAALAEVMGDGRLTPPRRERAIERLEQIGLVRRTAEGVEFDERMLRAALDANPPTTPAGPARYLDGDGRIDRYPVRADDRRELLAWVCERALAEEEILTEPQLNVRLSTFADDVALLRRHLVDAGLLERTRSGSSYARVSPGSI